MVVKCIFYVLFFGLTWAQSTEFALPDNFSLPPELEGKIDPNQLKDLQNQTGPIVRKKCEENGGPEAFEKAQKAAEEFQNCLKGLVNVETLNAEIEDAAPNGQVDEVFKKYCAEKPSFKKCFTNMTEAVKPCLTAKERENMKTVANVTEQVAEFICYKDGDRIALFISEGGRECFQEKQELLQDCANSTFGANLPAEGPESWTPDSIPNIAFGEAECKKLSALQACAVGVLEQCAKPTTANIVDSMFKFIRKATPCGDALEVKKTSAPGAASGLIITWTTLLLAVATSRLI